MTLTICNNGNSYELCQSKNIITSDKDVTISTNMIIIFQQNEFWLDTEKLFTKPVYGWITDASPFKISGEQLSRSNREGAAKDSKETAELKQLL